MATPLALVFRQAVDRMVKAAIGLGQERPLKHELDKIDNRYDETFLRSYVSRAARKFSDDYTGTHFQMLPPEILTIIGMQICTDEFEWSTGIVTLRHLSRFRLLCRITSDVGRNILISLSQRPGYRGPRSLLLPPRRERTLDDLLLILNGTGLGVVLRKIEFIVSNATDGPELEDKTEKVGRRDSGSRAIGTNKRSEIVIRKDMEDEKMFLGYLNSDVGFDKLLRLLDCLPNLKHLVFKVEATNTLHDPAYMTPEQLRRRPDPGYEQQHDVTYWDCLPRLFEIIKRYSLPVVSFRADSSMFINKSIGGSRVDTCLLKDACASITNLELHITHNDDRALGLYDPGVFDYLFNAESFRVFLASAVNLRRLLLEYALPENGDDVTSIDSEWMHDVLRDQFWPRLRKFEVIKADFDAETMLKFLLRHRNSLELVDFCDIGLPCPRDLVELCNGMRHLRLSKCEITTFRNLDESDEGEDELYEICQLYSDPVLDEDEDEEDLVPDVNSVDLGLYVLRKDTRGRYLQKL